MKSLGLGVALVALIPLVSCSDRSKVTKPAPVPSVQVTDLVVGSGDTAANGDTLVVTYEGRLPDGTLVDASTRRPFTFILGIGYVIPGWDQGMPGAREGGTRRMVIPPSLGYGAAGYPPVIPPNATLVFDVDLLEVRSAGPQKSP